MINYKLKELATPSCSMLVLVLEGGQKFLHCKILRPLKEEVIMTVAEMIEHKTVEFHSLNGSNH